MYSRYLKIVLGVFAIVIFSAQASFCEDGIQYQNVKKKDFSCDLGILSKKTPQGMEIEVSAIATGKGANFRGWEVTSVKMNLEGDILRPVKTEKFYVTKQSFFQGAAPLVFAAIGSQYERYADQAQSGGICPVTGETQAAYRTRSSFGKAIDQAGMAAGLGLLASQAKGEIEGKKCLFSLNQDQAEAISAGGGSLKVELENEKEHLLERLNLAFAVLAAGSGLMDEKGIKPPLKKDEKKPPPAVKAQNQTEVWWKELIKLFIPGLEEYLKKLINSDRYQKGFEWVGEPVIIEKDGRIYIHPYGKDAKTLEEVLLQDGKLNFEALLDVMQQLMQDVLGRLKQPPSGAERKPRSLIVSKDGVIGKGKEDGFQAQCDRAYRLRREYKISRYDSIEVKKQKFFKAIDAMLKSMEKFLEDYVAFIGKGYQALERNPYHTKAFFQADAVYRDLVNIRERLRVAITAANKAAAEVIVKVPPPYEPKPFELPKEGERPK